MNAKTALITGATSGIGRATAHRLAASGMNLILCGRNVEQLEALSNDLPVQVQKIVIDFSKPEEAEKILLANRLKMEKADILVNSAGVYRGGGAFQNADASGWAEMINVNVLATMMMAKAVVPGMLLRKSGHIVNLGSVNGRWVPWGSAAYSATKFAIRALSECFQADLLNSGVRVSNVEPGATKTNFSPPEFYEKVESLKSEDVADAIAWVIEQPQHSNIQELIITGADQYIMPRVARRKKDSSAQSTSERAVALISGATSEIGRATALALAAQGYDLALVDRSEALLKNIAIEIEVKHHVSAKYAAVDLTDQNAIAKLDDHLGPELKRCQVLVNSNWSSQIAGPFFKTSREEWQQIFDSNLNSTMHLSRFILPKMLAQRAGYVVNLGSIVSQSTPTNRAAAVASQFAMSALTEGIRRDLVGEPVHVTQVNTGFSESRSLAADVASAIAWSCSRPERVNVSEISMFATDQASPINSDC